MKSGANASERFIGTVFLDRDGTINRKPPEGGYVTSPEAFVFVPGAVEALRRLSRARARLIVVTNQRGIALGRMTEDDLAAVHRLMLHDLEAEGARVHAVYHCPHDVGECRCRKPDTGLFERAAAEHPGLTWETSVMIGDSPSDMQAASRLGIRRVMLAGHQHANADADADAYADSIIDAAGWALEDLRRPNAASPASSPATKRDPGCLAPPHRRRKRRASERGRHDPPPCDWFA